jgi:hypothetical protein
MVENKVVIRLRRFFGIPENTGFFEKPVFRFCQSSSTEKTGKRQRTGKKQDNNANVSANPS